MLRDLLESEEFKTFHQRIFRLPWEKIFQERRLIADIAKMPHLLVAGATGSGKVGMYQYADHEYHLYNADPEEVKLIMVDPESSGTERL